MEMSFLQVTAYHVYPVEEKHEPGKMERPKTLCFHSYKSSKRVQVIKCQTAQTSVAYLQKICH